ncbi:hypothetical protein G3H79_04100 [Streptomyces aureoverticillatus]|nr:hypothetical protein G3H79_04100 [Streptomyces aureoverticillatus]
MQRATRHLAGAVGIRQFLDLGSGIPTEPNLHRIAQGIAPEARVVYVDNDPIALAHAAPPRARAPSPQADVREPDRILELASSVLDFDRAVEMYRAGGVTLVPRSRARVERLFERFGLLEPGLVWPPDWRPELGVGEVRDEGTPVPLYAGVGRKR